MNSKQYKYRFTVFTTSYNRGHLLRDRYEDLLKQTFKDFEWVVVSNGSTDDTNAIVQSFVDEGKLAIKFIKKGYGGKHTAWRAATPLFEGRYVMTADDDDDIPCTALETFNRVWSDLEQLPNYADFWEVRARSVREDGKMVGRPTPGEFLDSDYNEIRYVYHIDCEMDGCRKVEVLSTEAAVPDYIIYDDKCTNFSEHIRWSRAARHYKTRFVNDVVRVFASTPNSLGSKRKVKGRKKETVFNGFVSSIYHLNEQRDLLLKYSPKGYLRACCSVAYQSIAVRVNPFKHIDKAIDKVIVVFAYIPMCVVYAVKG